MCDRDCHPILCLSITCVIRILLCILDVFSADWHSNLTHLELWYIKKEESNLVVTVTVTVTVEVPKIVTESATPCCRDAEISEAVSPLTQWGACHLRISTNTRSRSQGIFWSCCSGFQTTNRLLTSYVLIGRKLKIFPRHGVIVTRIDLHRQCDACCRFEIFFIKPHFFS